MATTTTHVDPKSMTDGVTRPLWPDTARVPHYPPLASDATADVCVVGAGISGLTAAYLLAKEGKNVIVLDDSGVGDGQTGRTSAHLASALDDRFEEIRKWHGDEGVQMAYRSHATAIDTIERISREENIDCDFARLDGYLFLSEDHKKDDPSQLDREWEEARFAGADVHKVDRLPLESLDDGPALRFANQGRFHPMKYLAGLCRAIEAKGGKIYCGSHVNDAQGGDVEKGELCKVTTDDEVTVQAKAIVVATNTPAPINDWAGVYTKQGSYRTYILTFRIPRGAVPDALYWDTGEPSKDSTQQPYHYVRVDQGDESGDLLVVGGEDHRVGLMDKHDGDPFVELEKWSRDRFPMAGEIAYRWSGQVQEPQDGLGFIGVAPTKKPNVYVITGDSGMGLTHGTLGAILVTDLIMRRQNAWQKLYEPTRKMVKALADFIKDNAEVAAQYKDYVTRGDVASEDEIRPGEGAIVRSGLKKLAVYRDESGQIVRMSAVCTHLGCIVKWNHHEKSWDCPCHGSRFNASGDPVMGPAVTPLKQVE
jgi:glycine/D-amino acid oxidase-like deaminating enzyme/nitrite reductase/ring-hydroxylating ferredoxin subunit